MCRGKAELTKQVIEGLEKDLDKLRKQDQNFRNKFHLEQTGINLWEETEDDRQQMRNNDLKEQVEARDAHILHCDEKRL